MADWKQITARIRRARTGKDPAGQLTNLFSKTRDAMVAFELARYFETNGNNADAGRWYLTAAQRFRRADWKTKAQESATRLGATEPAEIPATPARTETTTEEAGAAPATEMEMEAEAQPAVVLEEEVRAEGEVAEAAPLKAASAAEHGPRRGRGRRGEREQRGHRRGGHSAPARERHREPEVRKEPVAEAEAEERPTEPHRAVRDVEAAPPSLRGKYGDPGLSSRLTQLEMNFRRLLTCTATKLEDAGKAPAGPGVWVLTDSDLTTYYYVEACQTLRVAIPNILRGNAARRGESIAIKPALAEHLGIPEARVAKYLSDHCVVRWLQMDDDAAHFAHFLVAVLRPALNE
jgi:hypothetical protein